MNEPTKAIPQEISILDLILENRQLKGVIFDLRGQIHGGGKIVPREGCPRPQIVCLCGSSRLCDLAAVHAWNFEKAGVMAIGMHLLPHWYAEETQKKESHHFAEQEGVRAVLDELHLRKIDLADDVFVINPGGYIGDRTRIEIDYALSVGKPVKYLVAQSAQTQAIARALDMGSMTTREEEARQRWSQAVPPSPGDVALRALADELEREKDAHVHAHWTQDPETGTWETRNADSEAWVHDREELIEGIRARAGIKPAYP